MRYAAVLAAVLAAGCDLRPTHWETRGYSRSELEAGPSFHEIRAAITRDVRVERELKSRLDDGVPKCPTLKYVKDGNVEIPTCTNDDAELVVYMLMDADPAGPDREVETAYWCPEEKTYYYRYWGGRWRRDVWLGPYPINRKPRSLDEVEQP